MKYFFSFLLSVTITLTVKAQSNFKTGYVITLNGDTVKGAINYKEWEINPVKISFKPTGNDAPATEYGVNNAAGFGLDEYESYIRYKGKVSMNTLAVANLPVMIDTSAVIDTIFLKRVISDPRLSLFSYRDELKVRYFVAEGQGKPYELGYGLYLKETGATQINYYNKFQRQLLAVADKLGQLTEKNKNSISRARYTLSDIKKIIMALTGAQEVKGAQRSANDGHRFFAGFGINVSSLKYNGQNDLLVSPFNQYRSSYLPSVTIGYDKIFNKGVERWSLRVDLTLTANNPKMNFDYKNISGDHFIVSSNVKQYLAVFTPQFVYNLYNTPKLKVYINPGLALNFATYSYDYSRQSNTFLYKSNQYPLLAKFYVGMPIRAGVEINKKFAIHGGYQFPMDITAAQGISATLSSFTGGVNYFFGGSK